MEPADGNMVDDDSLWYRDGSNMSMSAGAFENLPLPDLSLSFDSNLDSSQKGIPLAMKGLKLGGNMFSTDSRSQSRKRKHYEGFDMDLSNSLPSKKTKTETGSIDFKDMMNITTHTTGDPFLYNSGGDFNFTPQLEEAKTEDETFVPFTNIGKTENETFVPFQTPTSITKKNPTDSKSNSLTFSNSNKLSFSDVVAASKTNIIKNQIDFNNNHNNNNNDVEMSPLQNQKPLKPISHFTLTSIQNRDSSKSWAEVCFPNKAIKDVDITPTNQVIPPSEKSDVSPSESGSSVTAVSSYSSTPKKGHDKFSSAPQSLQSNFASLVLFEENVNINNKEEKNSGLSPKKTTTKEICEKENKSTPKKPARLSDEERRQRRKHQIELGKETEGYKNYIKLVGKKKRKRKDPVTPDWEDVSTGKRRFDGAVRNWRRRLHDFDNLEAAKQRLKFGRS